MPPNENEDIEIILKDESLRNSYRKQIIHSLNIVEDYKDPEEREKKVLDCLIKLELWLLNIFKIQEHTHFPLELEERVVGRWTGDINMKIEDIINHASPREKRLEKEKKVETGSLEYYTEENIRHDLQAFVDQIDRVDNIAELTIRGIQIIRITCADGKTMVGQSYLRRAAFAHGMGESIYRASSASMNEALKILKNKLGIRKTTEIEYYTEKNIRHDLQAFVDEIDGINNIAELTVAKMEPIQITCANGERRKGLTYLARACVAHWKANKITEATNRAVMTEMLKILKNNLGIQIFEPTEMNKEYYTEENIRHDLEAFVCQIDGVNDIDALTVDKMIYIQITCANGEKMRGQRYLKRFAVINGIAMTPSEVSYAQMTKVLKILQRKLGGEYQTNDLEYYTEENIRYDLQAFVNQIDGVDNIAELTISGILKKEITCANGERRKGRTYLARAIIVHGIGKKNTTRTFPEMNKILKRFKATLGIQIVEPTEMNKEYYTEENIRHDLQAFVDQIEGIDSSAELTVAKMKSIQITCANGEKMRGEAYLKRFTVINGIARISKEVSYAQMTKVLKILQRKLGENI
jgi:hypothetical protein